MKMAYWDIETWDLGAEFGPVVCVSVLLLEPGFEDRMVTFRQDEYVSKGLAEDMTDDAAMLADVRDLLDEQHLHAGWFSKGFDIAHVNTRLALHGERLLKRKLHIDAIWHFKGWRGLKPRSSKMKHVSAFFGVEEKPEVSAEVWLKARGGNRKAIDEVCARCEADVRITRELTEKALELELIRNIGVYP